jgi:hypothetical protein
MKNDKAQDTRIQGRESNQRPSEYEAGIADHSSITLGFLENKRNNVIRGPPLWSSGQSSCLQIPGSIHGSTSSGSGTGSTQTREDN